MALSSFRFYWLLFGERRVQERKEAHTGSKLKPKHAGKKRWLAFFFAHRLLRRPYAILRGFVAVEVGVDRLLVAQ
jgi:hypothetical protein